MLEGQGSFYFKLKGTSKKEKLDLYWNIVWLYSEHCFLCFDCFKTFALT